MRKAAAVACKSLHKVTVRVCDGTTMSITGLIVYTHCSLPYKSGSKY